MKPLQYVLLGATLGVVATMQFLSAPRRQEEASTSAGTPTPVVPKDGKARAKDPAVSSHEASPLWQKLSDPKVSWQDRIEAVRSLPQGLHEQAVADLVAFLKEAPTGSRNDWYLVCNEIMEVLRKRNLAPSTYTGHMLGLIQSESADPVIRDYAAQTLAQWIANLDPTLGNEQDVVKVEAAFGAMLGEVANPANRELTLPGTTLHALADAVINGGTFGSVQKGQLAQAAFRAAANEAGMATFNRASALQVCARLEVPGVTDLCRMLLQNPDTPPDLQLSAIAALGQTGGAGDDAILERLVHDDRFAYAARTALARLQAP
jgi:hypothetical protein